MEIRKIWVTRLLLAVVLASGLHAAAGRAGSGKAVITLCHEDQDVPPWRYRKGGGLNFQLLDSAAREAGVILRYEAIPSKQCMARVSRNEIEGAFAVDFGPDRLDHGIYQGTGKPESAKELQVDRFVLLRRRGGSLEWDGRSLSHAGGPVGIQSGHPVGDRLRQLGATVEQSSSGAADVIRRLAAGRLAGAVVLAGEARRLLEHDSDLRSQVEILPTPLVETPYFLMLSRAFVQLHPQQAEALWQAIENIRGSASYQALERRTLAALGQG